MAQKRFKKPVQDTESQKKSVRFAEEVEINEFEDDDGELKKPG